ncbi:hypothetical protein ASE12_14160 [Aeromicrobium sp. Root236]|uniref:sugar ABC transporter substrate-binding protein n=1 Tax=Aeromicrobium sp. Root236 TaxID=1736498 RepID=UPI0006FD2E70|nr:sugar ABC transporter substrate-binding protein [Aeromicrobium sp. Root236]KRC65800.1 hypothetical protein ASE12_14160 [Aeromicrobium sp. Root236]
MTFHPTRKVICGLAGSLLVISLAACGSSGGGDGSGGTVGQTTFSLEYPFQVKIKDAAQKTAKKLGLKYVSTDPRGSVATELAQVEDLITRNVDAIVMIPVDPKNSQAAMRKINDAKIPLIIVNQSLPADAAMKYDAYVGSDDTNAGEIQADYVNKTLPDGGKLIYLVGVYGTSWTDLRKKGFMGNLHDNFKIVSEVQAKGDRAQGKNVMEDLLRKYKSGEVEGVVAQNDEMAIGAAAAIKEAGRQDEFKIVVGVDGSEAGLNGVQDGALTATVFQDAIGQGTQAIETAAKILKGETVAKQNIIPFKLVTKENLADFQ